MRCHFLALAVLITVFSTRACALRNGDDSAHHSFDDVVLGDYTRGEDLPLLDHLLLLTWRPPSLFFHFLRMLPRSCPALTPLTYTLSPRPATDHGLQGRVLTLGSAEWHRRRPSIHAGCVGDAVDVEEGGDAPVRAYLGAGCWVHRPKRTTAVSADGGGTSAHAPSHGRVLDLHPKSYDVMFVTWE